MSTKLSKRNGGFSAELYVQLILSEMFLDTKFCYKMTYKMTKWLFIF